MTWHQERGKVKSSRFWLNLRELCALADHVGVTPTPTPTHTPNQPTIQTKTKKKKEKKRSNIKEYAHQMNVTLYDSNINNSNTRTDID